MTYTNENIDAINRGWKDDFHMENGCYSNTCKECSNVFYGHKYRRICKECAGESRYAGLKVLVADGEYMEHKKDITALLTSNEHLQAVIHAVKAGIGLRDAIKNRESLSLILVNSVGFPLSTELDGVTATAKLKEVFEKLEKKTRIVPEKKQTWRPPYKFHK